MIGIPADDQRVRFQQKTARQSELADRFRLTRLKTISVCQAEA
jgi:hypothetical protein